MKDLTDVNYIKDVLGRHGFGFSRSLGQNFIINPSVCPRMAESCGASRGVGVLEVGPGVGVLTKELAQRADKVVAVEIDKRLIPVLNETLADYKNIHIINEDFMKLDVKELIEEHFSGMNVVMCANLPYYITSPLIMSLLEKHLPLKSVTVMVQKEAAKRLCAQDGTRECGAVTYSVRYFSEPSVLFDVSRGSFMPPPEVDSSVIRFDMRREPPVKVADEELFFRLIRAAFSQRRKTAVNAISTAGIEKTAIAKAMTQCGIRVNIRPEQLRIEDFAKLADILKG